MILRDRMIIASLDSYPIDENQQCGNEYWKYNTTICIIFLNLKYNLY